MKTILKLTSSLALLAGLAACGEEPPEDSVRARATAAMKLDVAQRFVSFFDARCALPESEGRAPLTAGLKPASFLVVGRYAKVPDYVELAGRNLAFWASPDDPSGRAILVVEEMKGSERCAAVTDSFDKATFAATLRGAYPEFTGDYTDDVLVNTRVFVDSPEGDDVSLVYSSYFDDEHGVSALVISRAESGN